MKTSAVRYVSPFALIAVFVLIRLVLNPWLGMTVPYLHLFPVVILSAWIGGFGPGIVATILSIAVANFMLLRPAFSFAIADPADRLSLLLFTLIALAFVWGTERALRAERAQRLAAERADAQAREFAAVFEAIPDGVYFGTADGITGVNTAGLRMLGAQSVEDLNARIDELGEKFAVRSASTGERLAPERLQFARALQGEIVSEEVLARRVDTGDDVVIRSFAAPIRANGRVVGAVAVNSDVSEQRRAAHRVAETNEALTKVTRRLAEVVANVPGVVWEAWGEPDGASQSIDFVSDHLTTVLGYQPSEWTAEPNFWLKVVHPDDKERAAAEARAIFAGGGVGHSEFRWVHRDGRIVWVEAHSRVVLDEEGHPIGMRGVTLDVTERKRLEEERAELFERAERARAEAVSANRLKDDFLATLSHELRTPLNAIVGYARMLRSGVIEPERQARALEVLERNATALTQIVADVLDVSRIVTGKIRLNVQEMDLAGVLQQAVATIAPAADAKGVRLQASIDPTVGAVSGDPDRLQQVAWNLLSNAVRFTPRDGRVEIRVTRIGSHAEIAISDSGAGINAEFLPHVFERFRQADSRFSREHGGLGLGLAISRELVQLHGGTIQAHSEGEGRGATFVVTLPLMGVQQQSEVAEERPAAGTPAAPLARTDTLDGLRILIVDDDRDALALMRDVLESAGAAVSSADGAASALTLLNGEVPDAIVTDLGMPVMDGFALLAAVRSSSVDVVKNVPIAALTAYARSEDQTRSLRSGFQMHLPKPIDPSELVAAVASLARRPPS